MDHDLYNNKAYTTTGHFVIAQAPFDTFLAMLMIQFLAAANDLHLKLDSMSQFS